MRRSKNQAVYQYLPEMWVAAERSGSNVSFTAKITNWNYMRMTGIYETFIEGEIKRQIRLFGNREGDISSFNITNNGHSFHIVEPACNKGIPDVIGEVSPLVFYCSSCGDMFELKSPSEIDKYTQKCADCDKKNIKQLQMVYSCECGYAQPISIPSYIKGVKKFKYKPNDNPYKCFYRSGNSEKTAEFFHTCPTCGSRLLPDNADSGRNYKPFSLKIINLVDNKSGKFYEKGIEAHKIIVARWFGKLTTEKYEDILNNIELAFSDEFRSDSKRKKVEEQVRGLIKDGLVPEALFQQFVDKLLNSNGDSCSVEQYINACDELFSLRKSQNEILYNDWLNSFSFKLMQYNTLKYAKRIITLEDAIKRQLEMELIDTSNDILQLNKKLGIANMQVTCDIQIINCTYGFTRKVADPKNSNNKNCRLKLNAFEKTKDGTANLVYGAKLDTEGILFEIDQGKIIEWLFKNDIILEEQMPDLDDELSVKKWFAEYVHGEIISRFGDIDPSEKITKNVFALLHSMSHAFIKTAGEISGLSGNSLTEIIIVETASIFIYAQSSQGIALGALSGMAESNYAYFLKKVLEETKNCIFDPICTKRDNTVCSACLIIPEVSCSHFNAELGRKYLYTYDDDSILTPKIGFWEM